MGRTTTPEPAGDPVGAGNPAGAGIEVLWITEHWPPAAGGMAQSCDRLVAQLRRRGIRVHVVHLSRKAIAIAERTQLGGSLLVWPLGNDPEHALARLHARLARAAGRVPGGELSHVVAFGGVLALLAAPVVAATLQRPLITLIRGNDLDTGVFSLRRRPIVADAIARSAAVCCVSRDKAALVEAMWPGTRTEWTPNGIDLDDWQVTAADRARGAAWRDHAVADDRRVIGLFGHLKQKKGVDWFVRAVAGSPVADRFHLLLVGDINDGVTDALGSLEPTAWTRRPFGDRYDLLTWLSACDAVAVPSFYDGLPNVVLEAAAVAVPLLASAASGMGDILIDGTHGAIFEPDDHDSLTEALRRIATCPAEEFAALGKAARVLVEEGYTAEIEARHYHHILDSVGAKPAGTVEP